MRQFSFCNDGTVILHDEHELIAEVQRDDPLYGYIVELAHRFADLNAAAPRTHYVMGSGGVRKSWVTDPEPLDSLTAEALSLIYEQRRDV